MPPEGNEQIGPSAIAIDTAILKKRSSIFLVVAGFFAALPVGYAIVVSYIGLIFSAADGASPQALLALLIPLIASSPWWSSFLLFMFGWHRISTALSVLAILIYGSALAYGIKYEIGGYYSRQLGMKETATVPAPSKGMLIPGPTTIADGFIKHFSTYTAGQYQISYQGPGPDGLYSYTSSYAPNSLTFKEGDFNDFNSGQKDSAGNVYGSYEFTIELSTAGLSKIQDFTFENKPGVIYGISYPHSRATYDLFWNDSGNPLEIEAFNTASFSSQNLIDMLDTMVRSDGTTLPNQGTASTSVLSEAILSSSSSTQNTYNQSNDEITLHAGETKVIPTPNCFYSDQSDTVTVLRIGTSSALLAQYRPSNGTTSAELLVGGYGVSDGLLKISIVSIDHIQKQATISFLMESPSNCQ